MTAASVLSAAWQAFHTLAHLYIHTAYHPPQITGIANAPDSRVRVLIFFSSCRYVATALIWAGSLQTKLLNQSVHAVMSNLDA